MFQEELQAIIQAINENIDINFFDEKVEGIIINVVVLLIVLFLYYCFKLLSST